MGVKPTKRVNSKVNCLQALSEDADDFSDHNPQNIFICVVCTLLRIIGGGYWGYRWYIVAVVWVLRLR
jgi:hypothetical protein